MSASEKRAPAVVAAEAGAAQWHSAVLAQQAAAADHADFYALAGEVVATLRALESLARLLAGQVSAYGDERALYDDEGGDPAERLAEAVCHAKATASHVAAAERSANRFWSAVGHIGAAAAP